MERVSAATSFERVVLVGHGLYRVECPWGRLPAGVEYTLVSSVAVDAQDRVYVCQRGVPPVVVFDASGEFINSWGGGVLADPHGIATSADSRVWVVDRDAHEVIAFDQSGRVTQRLGQRYRPRLQRPFNHPAGISVAHDGEIFVSDGYANSAIHRFSPDGRLIKTWGSPGAGPGMFTTPHSISCDSRGRLIVTDRENNRIQLFDREGAVLGQWLDHYKPMDTFEDSAGLVYVTDQIPRLSVLSATGELISRSRPVLYAAHGISGDSQGNLYMAEGRPTNRITKLVPLRAA